MRKQGLLLNVLLVAAALASPSPAAAADRSLATGGAGGVYPAGATFIGVEVRGLQLGVGAEIDPDGSGLGNFTAVLLGVSSVGTEQRITIQGAVTGGARNAANVAVLTGAATVDVGDGAAPAADVPFTATLTSGAGDLGTVALVVSGFDELPAATLDQGSLTIRSVPVD